MSGPRTKGDPQAELFLENMALRKENKQLKESYTDMEKKYEQLKKDYEALQGRYNGQLEYTDKTIDNCLKALRNGK